MMKNIFAVLILSIFLSGCSVLTLKMKYNKGIKYLKQNKTEKAISKFEEILPTIILLYGDKDTSILTSTLLIIANNSANISDTKKAEKYALQLVDIYKNNNITNDKTLGKGYQTLGRINSYKGNYSESKQYYLKAYNILKNDSLDTEVPGILSELALANRKLGNYSKSEIYYQQCINKTITINGDSSIQYAEALNNFGVFYIEMGNFKNAEVVLQKALGIKLAKAGKNSISYANTLNNIGIIYQKKFEYEKALPLYLEEIQITEKLFGKNHPSYAIAMLNLGTLYADMKDYQHAGVYINNALLSGFNYYNPNNKFHPDYALLLNEAGNFYYRQGKDYASALKYHTQSFQIRKNSLGDKHPLTIQSLFKLANTYYAFKYYDKATTYFIDAVNVTNNNIWKNFAFLSENEKELYFETLKDDYNSFYSFSIERINSNPKISEIVFNTVVKNKGLLLKSSTAMRTSILNSNDTNLISKYYKWIELKKEISALYSTEISKRKNNPEILEQQSNILEKELVKGSQVFNDFEKLQNLSWENVKKSLKQNEAAIEFLRYNEGKINETTTYYCALIITPNCQQPEIIKLFKENDIEVLLDKSGGNSYAITNNIYGTNQNTKDELYKLIWQPLLPYLKDIKTVFYAPDGLLHKVSFAALGIENNVYLSDKYNLQQVSSTGVITIQENKLWENDITVSLFGGIKYSSDSTNENIWQYLPGTKTETDIIANILKKRNIRTLYFFNNTASEDTIKTIASNCNILHISTHGFFYPNPEQLRIENKGKIEENEIAFRGKSSSFGYWQFVNNQNPLMRSGLVMAGANKAWNEPYSGNDNEGIFTAQEVTQLDLSKTKLVVLSACETGLGDIKGSEGVYGLQRAFKMAGAKYIVMSLWQVPDKETVEFMNLFYNNLFLIKDVRTAFLETQNQMRKKYDPYYWAAFVLVD